jgi:hypothetical protein
VRASTFVETRNGPASKAIFVSNTAAAADCKKCTDHEERPLNAGARAILY